MQKKLDMVKLAIAIRNARLGACLAGNCECITTEEHEKNVRRAKELQLEK